MIVGFGQTDHTYFDYKMDCPIQCVSINESCTIHEDGVEFIKLCYLKGKSCANLASNKQVCLQVDRVPTGGEAIWETYRRKYYPDSNTCTCSKTGLIISLVFNCIIAVVITIKMSINIIRRVRRADYVRIPNEVYNETVEDIEQ